MIGKRVGALIIESCENVCDGVKLFLCSCDCGKSIKLTESLLLDNKVRSCGCLRIRSKIRKINRKTVSKYVEDQLYKTWVSMKSRCYTPSQSEYNRYGGRNISVCREWRTHFPKFKSFCLQNGWKPGLEIDRINTNGSYSPDNCRFVEHYVNMRNQKNSYRYLINEIEYETAQDAGNAIGVHAGTIINRCRKKVDGYYRRRLYDRNGNKYQG